MSPIHFGSILSPASVKQGVLGFALTALLCTPLASFAHGSNHGGGQGSMEEDDDDEDHNAPFTFFCTMSGGVVMGTRLPEDCKKWWPACVMMPPPPKKKFPKHCLKANFKVVHIPTANGDEFIESRVYSTQSSERVASHKDSSAKTQLKLQGSKQSGEDEGESESASARGSSQNEDSEPGSASTGFLGSTGSKGGKATGIQEASRSATFMASANENSGAVAAGGAGTVGRELGKNATATGGGPAASGKESTYQAYLAGKFAGAAKTPQYEASGENLPANDSITKKHEGFTDPWMDYVTASSREELVDRLTKNSKLRDELQRRLNDINDGSGSSDPGLREKTEYYRKALLEAKNRLKRGTFEELAPMDINEAFSMNGDETEREIKRLLSSMDESAASMSDKDEGLHYPLFPRVRRALWRQLASGNINIKAKVR